MRFATSKAFFRYLELLNPTAARRVANDLLALGDSLQVFPHRGRPVRQNRRELLSVWPYIIRYKVDGDVVRILRVRHATRQQD